MKKEGKTQQKALAVAEARGVAIKSEILNRQGPPLSSSEVERRLGIGRKALLERRKRGSIIALHSGHHGFLYPRWQFGEGKYGLVPGLSKVLHILRNTAPWTIAIFLLKKHPSIAWQTPLELLTEGHPKEVIQLAESIKADASKKALIPI